MKIIIKNSDKLTEAFEDYGMKPASSIQKLVIEIISQAEQSNETEVTIKIHISLVAASYMVVPAMFANSISARVGFPELQSVLRNQYLYIYAGDSRKPLNFRARAVAAILAGETFSCKKELVPESYRKRPGMFSSILSNLTSHSICNGYKKGKMIWFAKE